MSIWTRITDSLKALARGEALSDVFERMTRQPEHTVAFTIAVIALGAKMAKADGRVTRDEVAAFRQIFNIPKSDEQHAARVFNMARTDVAGFDVYAKRIAAMFADRPKVLEDLLEGLVYVSMADGEYHPNEALFLEEVARIFGIDERVFRAMRVRHLPGEINPYEILGLEPGVDAETLRKRYRTLARELHPDLMIARGVPEEARKLAEQRLAAVNDAYAKLRRELA